MLEKILQFIMPIFFKYVGEKLSMKIMILVLIYYSRQLYLLGYTA